MQQDKPLVSVLMTLYNREDYLAEAIESVINSTYENWELIIVDDGSKDKSVEIANSYAKKDKRIKVYINEENLGDYPNRNQAAFYAKGKYIKYLDSDDIIYFYALEMLVRSMEQYPYAAAGLMSINLPENKPFPIYMTQEEAYKAFFLKGALLTVGPSATIYKREIFEELGKFSGINYAGDTEFHLKLCAKYPIIRVQPSFFYYRVHEGQQLNEGIQNDSYFRYNYKVFMRALSQPDCPLTQQEILFTKRRIYGRYSKSFIKLLIKGNFQKVNRYIKEFSFPISGFIWAFFPNN